MRFTIVGAGAIGGILATHLARIGDVAVVARGSHLEVLQTRGLAFAALDGSISQTHPAAAADPADLPAADITFVTVKAHAVLGLADKIRRSLAPDGLAVFVQNGIPWWYLRELLGRDRTLLDPEGRLAVAFPRCAAGIASYGGQVLAPGTVRQSGGGQLQLGLSSGNIDARLERVVSGLNSVGLKCQLASNVPLTIWRKLTVNVALNGVAVLTRKGILDLLNSPGSVEKIQSVAEEIADVARTLGFSVGLDVEMQRSITSANQKSSTLLDLEAGRPIEFDALFGAPLLIADWLGLHTPELRELARNVRAAVQSTQLSV